MRDITAVVHATAVSHFLEWQALSPAWVSLFIRLALLAPQTILDLLNTADTNL